MISDGIEYDIVENMKTTKANISLYEVNILKKKHKILLNDFNATPKSPLSMNVVTIKTKNTKTMSKSPSFDKMKHVGVILTGDRSNSHTPPFLIIFYFSNKIVNNCLVHSGASSNIMPYFVYLKMNVRPRESTTQIVQLDRSKVKVLGEIK